MIFRKRILLSLIIISSIILFSSESVEEVMFPSALSCERIFLDDRSIVDDYSLYLIAQTLAGECYEEQEEDKRKVAQVIVNRVSSGRYGNDIYEVLSSPNQFTGFWKQSRSISESDIRIAKEVLEEWYLNDCQKLSSILSFSAGPNRTNVFR